MDKKKEEDFTTDHPVFGVVISLDTGNRSTGGIAIEVDKNKDPISILNAMVTIHDGGEDPTAQKTHQSRKAISGVARRNRNRGKHRTARENRLENFMDDMGWKGKLDLAKDPYLVWRLRQHLANVKIEDPVALGAALRTVFSHIARHRGWRSPWVDINPALMLQDPSIQLQALKKRVYIFTGKTFKDDATIAEVAWGSELVGAPASCLNLDQIGKRIAGLDEEEYKEALAELEAFGMAVTEDGTVVWENKPTHIIPLRGEGSLLRGKYMQSDNAAELLKIARVQEIDGHDLDLANTTKEEFEATTLGQLTSIIFHNNDPRRIDGELVGKDPFHPDEERALSASLYFEQFRAASSAANLRIVENGKKRRLTQKEVRTVYQQLMEAKTPLTWADVAENLKIHPEQLKGVGTTDESGAAVSGPPPIATMEQRFLKTAKGPELEKLRNRFKDASTDEKEMLFAALSNAIYGHIDEDCEEFLQIENLLSGLSSDALEQLDKVMPPARRASYGVTTLQQLTKQILENEGVDVHEALVREYKVPPNWEPPAAPLLERTGNPITDRNTMAQGQWINAIVERTGQNPLRMVVETGKDGFKSAKGKNAITRHQRINQRGNEAIIGLMKTDTRFKGAGYPTRDGITKAKMMLMQDFTCIYCGKQLQWSDTHREHMIPRAGVGATSDMSNLVASCDTCNSSKDGRLPLEWKGGDLGAIKTMQDRIKNWTNTITDKDGKTMPLMAPKTFIARKRDIKNQLRRTTEDDPVDDRSIEANSYSSRELLRRLRTRFPETETLDDGTIVPATMINSYNGRVTHLAREYSGIKDAIKLLGGKGKTRIDRRHHVIDAAANAFVTPGVARVLIEKDEMRREEYASGRPTRWREHMGQDAAHREEFRKWLHQMDLLIPLLIDKLKNDQIHVIYPLRLRAGNSEVHLQPETSEEGKKRNKLYPKAVGEAWDLHEIDRLTSDAAWCALTRCPDFDKKEGLPASKTRTIKVNGTRMGADDLLEMFVANKNANDPITPRLKVRGSAVPLNNTYHHMRVYKYPHGKKMKYGGLRVTNIDLLKGEKEARKNGTTLDLFNMEIPPQSRSMRGATRTLRNVLEGRDAQYLGFMIHGDEIHIPNIEEINHPKVNVLNEYFGTVFTNWTLFGMPGPEKLLLRPTYLSAEGLPDDAPAEVKYIVEGKGWIVTINSLMSQSPIEVIRRNKLGEQRWSKKSGMITSWRS